MTEETEATTTGPAVAVLRAHVESTAADTAVHLRADGFAPESKVTVFRGAVWCFNTRVNEHGGFGATVHVGLKVANVQFVAVPFEPEYDFPDGIPTPPVRDLEAAPLASVTVAVTPVSDPTP